MEAITAWVVSVADDLSILAHEYFPEALAVAVIVGLLWAIRHTLSRDARSSH